MAYPQNSYLQTTFTTPGFISRRREVVYSTTLLYQLKVLKTTGRYGAFKLKWHASYNDEPDVWPVPNHLFWDSDVAKWIEGACYFLQYKQNQEIDTAVKELVDMIRSAQQDDGYLNIHFTVVEPGKRFTNIRDLHELYNAGHLIEAALAHNQYYGNDLLLEPILKYVDLLSLTFGPNPKQKHGYPGHPEIELALLRLYEKTRDPKHLNLARYFIDERGNPKGQDGRHYYDVEAEVRGDRPDEMPKYFPEKRSYWYQQAHKPIVQQETIEGHAVRAMYLLTAVSDLVRVDKSEDTETKRTAVERLWNNMVQKKMYLTGGIGAIKQWEGFGIDYFLPSGTDEGGCYSETCASIGVMMLAERLLQLDLDGKYADIMELCFYNAVSTGMSEDGSEFTYVNQLASSDTDLSRRAEWFTCACCPPNVSRLLGYIGGYLWTSSSDEKNHTVEVNVHTYASAVLSIPVDEHTVQLEQKTDWPWDGNIRFDLKSPEAISTTIRLRIPGWAEKWTSLVLDTECDISETDVDSAEPYKELTVRNGATLLKVSESSGPYLAHNEENFAKVDIQRLHFIPYALRDNRGGKGHMRVGLRRKSTRVSGPYEYNMNRSSKKKDLRVQTAPDMSVTNIVKPKTSLQPRTYTEEEVQGFVGTVLDMAVQLLEGKRKREAPREVSENNLESDSGSGTENDSLQSRPAPACKKRALDTDKEIICNTPAITAEPPRPTINRSLPSNNVSRRKRGSRQNTRVKSQGLPILFNPSVPSPRDNKLPTRRFYGDLACAVMSTENISAKIMRHLKAPADYDSHGKLLSTRVSVGLPAMNAAGQILLVDGNPMPGFLRDIAVQFPRYDKIEATAKAAVYGKDAAWYEQKFRATNARHLSRAGTGNQNGPEAGQPTRGFSLNPGPGRESHTEPVGMFPFPSPRNAVPTKSICDFSSALPHAPRCQILPQPASVHGPTIRQSVPKLSVSEDASRILSSDNRVRPTLVARGSLGRLDSDNCMLKTTQNNRITSPAVSPDSDIEAENLVRECEANLAKTRRSLALHDAKKKRAGSLSLL
ncbi:hypothetical protein BPAE_0022g00220 [Botrytis paeoniae]|uniref:Glycoside hydrolase family 127 protein n=1 Tax=Botrytis paeoniae TaxID=278948 RepID=A0A4Z1G0I0_9HELO|nr:hypothetical protein BPAE_0022g00220 [Botrytis paeoniae]